MGNWAGRMTFLNPSTKVVFSLSVGATENWASKLRLKSWFKPIWATFHTLIAFTPTANFFACDMNATSL